MAIYHCTISIGSRSGGQSAIAHAAYCSGTKLEDRETGVVSDYTHKGGVVYSEIQLPKQAPAEYADRETLWNAVHKVEHAANAQLYRSFEVALPVELTLEEHIKMVHEYVQENFVDNGMCVDWSIHYKAGNPHAHITATTRPIKENGEWGLKEKKAYKLDEQGQKIPVIDPETGKQKVRIRKGKGEEKLWERETVQVNDWNDRGKAEEWRAAWADVVNRYLEKAGREERVDHRSYARQGIDREPTIHVGPAQAEIKAKGIALNNDVAVINMRIKEKNRLQEMIRNIDDEMTRLKSDLDALLPALMEEVRKAYERIKELARDIGIVREDGKFDVARADPEATNREIASTEQAIDRAQCGIARTKRSISIIDIRTKIKDVCSHEVELGGKADAAREKAGRSPFGRRKLLADANKYDSQRNDYKKKEQQLNDELKKWKSPTLGKFAEMDAENRAQWYVYMSNGEMEALAAQNYQPLYANRAEMQVSAEAAQELRQRGVWPENKISIAEETLEAYDRLEEAKEHQLRQRTRPQTERRTVRSVPEPALDGADQAAPEHPMRVSRQQRSQPEPESERESQPDKLHQYQTKVKSRGERQDPQRDEPSLDDDEPER